MCCGMRAHFLVGIVGERSDEPVPIDVADFMVSWDLLVVGIKFCPFCGAALRPDQLRNPYATDKP